MLAKMLVFAITTQCGSFRNNIKQARNVVCDARWGRLRERTGAMSGLAGANTAAYGTLANRAQFRRRVRMVIAAASGQAVSRHCSQPLHLLPRRSAGKISAQVEARRRLQDEGNTISGALMRRHALWFRLADQLGRST